jgi:hypothetical protein
MAERDGKGKFVKAGSEGVEQSLEPEIPPAGAEIPPPADETPQEEIAPPGKRGRGRPPGSGKTAEGPKKRAGSAKSDPDKLARQIVGGHMLAATFTGLPELVISTEEGRILADAMITMTEEYGLVISGKTAAAMQLLAAVGIVYAPRAILIITRINANQQQEPPAPGNVYEMRKEL